MLLSWLKLHDRPAVQVEALLALTTIAELCAQQSYGGQAQSSGIAAGAKAQTLSMEAVEAFKASTKQNNILFDKKKSKQSTFSLPPAPLSPSSAPKSNSFLPPPRPVPGSRGGALAIFPQQLSPYSQHLLLRDADAIPTLISLLSSPRREIYEQAMWILGSIVVGDSAGTSSSGGSLSSSPLGNGGREKAASARDMMLAAGVMNKLLRCLEAHPENLSLQRIGTWTLSNLVEGIFQRPSHGKKSRGKSRHYSSSDEIEMSSLLPVLRRLLRMADAEVLSYTCWAISHLCDGPSSHIAEVVTTKDPKAPKGGLVPRLVELLLHASWRVKKPALRTIRKIVCAENGNDDNHGTTTDYTKVILDCGAVPRLKELAMHKKRGKEASWILSNIAAGTVDQIQAVIDSDAIPPLVEVVRDKKSDQEVCSEAGWVVLNATSSGSDSQTETLVDEGCLETREVARKEQIKNGEIKDDEETRIPTLVSSDPIEKARSRHSSEVTKRASKLCNDSLSKHRNCQATVCEECKCHICSNRNKQIHHHLSHQEEEEYVFVELPSLEV